MVRKPTNRGRAANSSRPTAYCLLAAPPRRRGAILLIVLGLLSLFMLITISFVLESGHARRGSMAAAKAEQQGDPPDTLLNLAARQVIRGPRTPNSVIGPHSLLEDLYGEYDSVVGAIAQDGASGAILAPRLVMADQFVEITGIGFGPDRKPGTAGTDDDGDGVIDNVSESPLSSTKQAINDDFRFGQMPYSMNSPAYTSPPGGQDAVEGYYAGRVLTMLTGSCAKLSTRIVRYFESSYNAQSGLGSWVMWIEPFKTVPVTTTSYYTPLNIGDTFLINGRPFNGGGFGYDPNAYNPSSGRFGQPDTSLSWYSLFNPNGSAMPNYSQDTTGISFPFALTPNPMDPMYRDYLNDRPFVNPMSGAWSLPPAFQAALNSSSNPPPAAINVSADEDYDAPDFQNMMLAQRTWIPSAPLVGAVAGSGSWQVRIPSLHRPELVDYWMRAYLGANPAQTPWTQLPAGQKKGSSFAPRLRQRIMLRPDPNDHVYQDINPHNGQWDYGEPNWSSNSIFNPITGPWDVDNDNDGSPDSIWVDLGAPVQTAIDGTQFKPLFAILCLDMDGRLNLNAHGNSTQYTFANPTGAPSYPYNNPQYTPSTHPGNLVARTDEANILGATRYHGNAVPPGGSWPVPLPLNYPFAANSPSNPSIGSAADYVFSQQPNSYEFTFPSFPTSSSGSSIGWNKQVGVGLGFSVADINLAPVLAAFPSSETGYPNSYVRSSRVRWTFEGRYEGFVYPQSNNYQRPTIPGRYGEAHLNANPNTSYKAGTFPWPRPRAGITGNQTTLIMGGAVPNSTGDDNVPTAVVGASAMLLPVPGANITQPFSPNYSPVASPALGQPHGDFYTNAMVGNSTLATSIVNPGVPIPGYTGPAYTNGYVRQGNNGSPIDPNGRLIPGLDLRGQPIYANMPSQIYPSNELIDDPWELDLSDSAARTALLYIPQNFPRASYKFEIDKPFAPADLETILRYADVDQWALAQRAEQMFEMNSADPQGSGDFRNRVTTESWDIPVPNIIAPPEIMVALRTYGLPTDNLTFTDLVRGKILAAYLTLQIQIPGGSLPPMNVQTATNQAQTLLGCNQQLLQTTRVTDRGPYRAISPDLLLGLRMDLNRPFGNGIDDNGNGTIDEPFETLQYYTNLYGLNSTVASTKWSAYSLLTAPEPMWKSLNTASTQLGIGMDSNWDGYLTFNDAFARQEFAKHLYTLMMLVTDLKYTVVYPTIDNLPKYAAPGTPAAFQIMPLPPVTTVTGLPSPAQAPTPREILHAYRVAQWAVNVVDFRDRDSIMTWFEFDIRPFYHDTATLMTALNPSFAPPATATWEVDGLLSTGTAATAISFDDVQPFRGLVWGMEYPDLLITETTAFHDKALADSGYDTNALYGSMGQHTTQATKNKDATFDQIRLPQGSLFIELYCTGRPNTPGYPTASNAPPYAVGSAGYNALNYPNPNLPYYPPELYDVTNPITFPLFPNGVSTRQGALVLSKTDPTGIYPVWRVALTKPGAGTGLNNASNVQARFQRTPDQAILQPQVLGTGFTANPLVLETSCLNNYVQAMQLVSPNSGATPQGVRLNMTIDRVAYFTPYNSTVAALNPTVGASFFYTPPPTGTTAVPGLPTTITPSVATALAPAVPSLNNIFLQPGCYAVMGPYRGPNSEAKVAASTPSTNNVTFIGYVNPAKLPPSKTCAQYINLQSQAQSTTVANMVVPCINHTSSSVTGAYTAYPYPSTAAGTASTSAKIKFPLGIPLATPAGKTAVTTITATTPMVGLNISEPNGGYSTITGYIAPTTTTKYQTGTLTATVTDTWSPQVYPDIPFDTNNNRLGSGASTTLPGLNDDTTLDCCTALLQRLADPTMPFNEFTNPYLTIDWMNVDLTVFNGQSSYLANGTATLVATPDTFTTSAAGVTVTGTNALTPFNFQTRQRGPRVPPNALSTAPSPASVDQGGIYPQGASGTSPYAYGWPMSLGASTTGNTRNSTLAGPNSGATNYGNFNGFNEAPLWSSMSDDPQPTRANNQSSGSTKLPANTPIFNHYLYGTLGYLNEGYGLVNATGLSPGAIDGYFVNGALTRYPTTNLAFNVLYDYVGDPIRPFPWLTWNNRPFANPMELLLVPASSPERFGWEFTYKTHYTDNIASRLLGQTYPQYKLIDNHYAPMRNPYWDYFSAARLWGNAGNSQSGTFSLQPVAPLLQTSTPPTTTTATNLASSQTMFPPQLFDPTIDYINDSSYQNLSSTTYPPFDQPNVLYTPLIGYSTSGSALGSGPLRGGHPFGHLLNFFNSSTSGPAGAPLFASNWPMVNGMQMRDALALLPAPNYFRVLELVTVPSPFAGTENLILPVNYTGTQAGQPAFTALAGTSGYGLQAPYSNIGTAWPPPPQGNVRFPLNAPAATTVGPILYPFRAPFNRTSRFREPGRINVNTISDRDISFTVNNTINFSYNDRYGANYDRMGGYWPQTPIWQGVTNDFPNNSQQYYDMKGSMSVVDPRGPDHLWYGSPAAVTNDDLWPPNQLNLYAVGQPASVNTAIQNSLNYANLIAQSANVANTLGQASVAVPTIYTNPFRSYLNPMRAPIAGMWNRLKMSPTNYSPQAAPLLFVDATMLRRADPDIFSGSEPVFTLNTYGWGNYGASYPVATALGSTASSTNLPAGTLPTQTASLLAAPPTPQFKLNAEMTSSYNDPNRNPFFRYYPLQKIGATTTTHSNVYAVWITVGYFEVQKIPANPQQLTVDARVANPDGYQLVRELYSDIGAATRNRGFFILDRSIPVGFMRGENLNVDKAILLRRIIQ